MDELAAESARELEFLRLENTHLRERLATLSQIEDRLQRLERELAQSERDIAKEKRLLRGARQRVTRLRQVLDDAGVDIPEKDRA